MKKLVILFILVVLIVPPAYAQKAARGSRAPKANPNVGKLLNAYNRMGLANREAEANASPNQAKDVFNPFSSINSALQGFGSSGMMPGTVPGDRPFDSSVAVNPFVPTGPSSGDPSNPAATFGVGVDVFSIPSSTVNPFLPENLWTGVSLSASPGDLQVPTGTNLGKPLSFPGNAPGIRKPPSVPVKPVEALKKNVNLTPNPFKSVSAWDLPSIYRSPYSSNSLFPNTALQPSIFP